MGNSSELLLHFQEVSAQASTLSASRSQNDTFQTKQTNVILFALLLPHVCMHHNVVSTDVKAVCFQSSCRNISTTESKLTMNRSESFVYIVTCILSFQVISHPFAVLSRWVKQQWSSIVSGPKPHPQLWPDLSSCNLLC